MSDELSDLRRRLAAKKLTLVFAAESGSRAWGFHSPDSDYDIRFIFAKPVDKYLSLHDGTQDIQYKHGELDYAGWDLRKAFLLAEKSNPSLIEWLRSPIVYDDPVGIRTELNAIMSEHFSPRALAHHYINFMRNIRGKYLSDFIGEYTMKRYFYALRPILCILYMQAYPDRLPPVVFQDLLGSLTLEHELKREIQKLLVLKFKAKEREDYSQRIREAAVDEACRRAYRKLPEEVRAISDLCWTEQTPVVIEYIWAQYAAIMNPLVAVIQDWMMGAANFS